MPYLPILDVLKGYFDIEEGDREPAIKKKLREKLRQLDEKAEVVPPALHEVLSLKVEDDRYRYGWAPLPASLPWPPGGARPQGNRKEAWPW